MTSLNRIIQSWLIVVVFAGYIFAPFLYSESIDDQVRRISHQLRCPTCQSQSVKESDAGLSMNMKNKIREMLNEGKSEEEIFDFFVERYGEWILRSPEKKGFNLFLWLAPGFLIVLTVGLLARYLLKRPQLPLQNSVSVLSEKEKAVIEKDLERFKMD